MIRKLASFFCGLPWQAPALMRLWVLLFFIPPGRLFAEPIKLNQEASPIGLTRTGTALAWAEGRPLLAVGEEGKIQLFDFSAEIGRKLQDLDLPPSEKVKFLLFLSDGQIIFGTSSGKISVWNPSIPNSVASQLKGSHKGDVVALALDKNRSRLASVGKDGKLIVWKDGLMNPAAAVAQDLTHVLGLTFFEAENGEERIAWVNENNELWHWNFDKKNKDNVIDLRSHFGKSVEMDLQKAAFTRLDKGPVILLAEARFPTSTATTYQLLLFEVKTGRLLKKLGEYKYPITAIGLEGSLVSAIIRGQLYTWQLSEMADVPANGLIEASQEAQITVGPNIEKMAWEKKGRFLAALMSGRQIQVWKASGAIKSPFEKNPEKKEEPPRLSQKSDTAAKVPNSPLEESLSYQKKTSKPTLLPPKDSTKIAKKDTTSIQPELSTKDTSKAQPLSTSPLNEPSGTDRNTLFVVLMVGVGAGLAGLVWMVMLWRKRPALPKRKAFANVSSREPATVVAPRKKPTPPRQLRMSEEEDFTGHFLGKYRIDKKLAEGGMGMVFRATDSDLSRSVIIKTFIFKKDEELLNRFLREAQAAANLKHPNIVVIHTIERSSDPPFIVMEDLGDVDLGDLLEQKKKLSLGETVQYLKPVAEALDFAHQQGVVHRDIKPSNLMISPQGVIKVVDFGVAKQVTSRLTKAGYILGTPGYMSPEQWKGGGVNGQSDQYSLAVVAFELLSGRLPFSGDTPALMFKVLTEVPPMLPELVKEIPPPIAAVVNKGLSKEPQERYQSCIEFVNLLSSA